MDVPMLRLLATTHALRLPDDGSLELGLPIYEALLSRYDSHDMVLLESLGRSSTDARSTLIAVGPLLSIEVRGCNVRITGRSAVIPALAECLQKYQCVAAHAETIECVLSSRDELWNFLRRVESVFEISGIQGSVPLSLFGYWGYETISYIEPVLGQRAAEEGSPAIVLTMYQTLISLEERVATVTSYSLGADRDVNLDEVIALCERSVPCLHEPQTGHDLACEVELETSCADYLAKCHTALEHIRLGDVYQIQIGQKVRIRSELPPLELYKRMRARNPSPYMYLFTAAGSTVVGASPELFVRIEGSQIVMRPIAGTVGKKPGLTQEAAAAVLHGSEKEVAEHLMLVDLCRNDVSRTCEPHSLDVSELMAIEEYSHVFHMVSNVTGQIRPGYDKYEVIRHAFPAGTMTGTPKVRAIELIDRIEDSAREHYAGAVGLVGIGNNYLNTALCIRSAVFDGSTYTLRASAGIVSDSTPESEYQETLHKLGSVFSAITGKELL